MNKELSEIATKCAQDWLKSHCDKQTKKIIETMLQDTNKIPLIEAFHRNLDFGTGGLRGIMGVGANRINEYTIAKITLGLAKYIQKTQKNNLSIAIAYDSRNNSQLFSQVAANQLIDQGFDVYLFEDLRPTPELSFAIRHYKCSAGIVMTASHNPKEYNGYKVYWNDGAQITSPHDKNLIDEISSIEKIPLVDTTLRTHHTKLHLIGQSIDHAYLEKMVTLFYKPFIREHAKKLTIAYTPLHGTGITLIPALLEKSGFKNIIIEETQKTPDGNFPTVKFPNPESPEAMSNVIETAKKNKADIAMATDPDTDRVSVAVRDDHQNDYVFLNGNQAGAILTQFVLSQYKKQNKLKDYHFIAKTIVTTPLLDEIAKAYNIKCYNVLTGFKYIGELIREKERLPKEEKEKFIVGGEESFGYLLEDFVRDKDAVVSVAIFSEIALHLKVKNKTLIDFLNEIYQKYGYFYEKMSSITKEGINGAQMIKNKMKTLREKPFLKILDERVVQCKDYLTSQAIIYNENAAVIDKKNINLPQSNVLQYITQNNTIITVRPSGTEPKIKFYISFRRKEKMEENQINQIFNHILNEISPMN